MRVSLFTFRTFDAVEAALKNLVSSKQLSQSIEKQSNRERNSLNHPISRNREATLSQPDEVSFLTLDFILSPVDDATEILIRYFSAVREELRESITMTKRYPYLKPPEIDQFLDEIGEDFPLLLQACKVPIDAFEVLRTSLVRKIEHDAETKLAHFIRFRQTYYRQLMRFAVQHCVSSNPYRDAEDAIGTIEADPVTMAAVAELDGYRRLSFLKRAVYNQLINIARATGGEPPARRTRKRRSARLTQSHDLPHRAKMTENRLLDTLWVDKRRTDACRSFRLKNGDIDPFVSFCLNELSKEDRQFINLKFDQSLTESEIGSIFGISHQAVSRRWERIRKRLSCIMKKKLDALDDD